MEVGYKLAAEAYGPRELVRQAVRAEQAGFDFGTDPACRSGDRCYVPDGFIDAFADHIGERVRELESSSP